jgi:hypothetical protein
VIRENGVQEPLLELTGKDPGRIEGDCLSQGDRPLVLAAPLGFTKLSRSLTVHPISRWSCGDAPIEDRRQDFFDPFHRNDGEFVADSGLLIPLEPDTPYIWLDDPAMVRACLQMLPSCQLL